MIINFEFSNFKSFKNEQFFSMRRKNDAQVLFSNNETNAIERVVAIYGANAAGKTGVLEAFDALVAKATHEKKKEDRYNRDYSFAGRAQNLVSFKLEFTAGKKQQYKYCYGIRYNTEYIDYEALSVYNSSRPTTIFMRQYNAKRKVSEVKKMDKGFTRDQRDAVPYFLKTQPATSLLSFLNEDQDKQKDDRYKRQHRANQHTANAYDFFMHCVDYYPVLQTELIIGSIPRILKENPDAYKWFNMLLPAADFGVSEIGTTEDDNQDNLSSEQEAILIDAMKRVIKIEDPSLTDEEIDKRMGDISGKTMKIFFSHYIDGVYTKLSPDQESRGTLTALKTFAELVPTLHNGGVLMVDELDCSLHPMLVAQIVDVFNNPDTNPHGAQLIFTTHDVTLLDKTIYGEEILSRDEVWFVEKDKNGASTLYPLRSIKNTTRKEDNLYRKYVEGRYGAIPRASISSRIEAYWMDNQDA